MNVVDDKSIGSRNSQILSPEDLKTYTMLMRVSKDKSGGITGLDMNKSTNLLAVKKQINQTRASDVPRDLTLL